MRTFAIALLATTCLFLGACGGDSGGGGGSPEGTYVMDMESMKPEVEKMVGPMFDAAMKMLEMLPEDQRAAKKKELNAKKDEAMAEAMKNMNFSAVLNSDGTFHVKEGDAVKAKGTWKLDGETMTFTTTEEDGKKKDNPEALAGTFKNGTIRFKPEKDMPFDLVFKKQ
ncbi:MAG: DUF5004 domain-containing protein [Planctomycetota bacterium]|nr:DUF5004 domain-containing protein [Planctomycetota bacterium]